MNDFAATAARKAMTGLSFNRRWVPPLNIARKMSPWLLIILAYGVLVCSLVSWLNPSVWKAGNELAATLGVGIGMLMAFRNNAANDRWWEARKAWGQLINDSRNMALKARAYYGESQKDQSELAGLLIDFARSLTAHVRGKKIDPSALRTAGVCTEIAHVPGYFAGRIHQLLSRWHKEGMVKEIVWMLDQHARTLMDVCGVCERIRNTPLASSYRALLRGGLVLYIVLAPWSVSLEIGWWSIPVLAIGIGLLLGMELTAEAIEEPFGIDGDDLPLEAFCKSIEDFVLAALDVPASTRSETVEQHLYSRQPVMTTLPVTYEDTVGHDPELLTCGV